MPLFWKVGTWASRHPPLILQVSILISALLWVSVAGNDANEDLWLIGLVPFTSFGWDAGSSLRVGAELMLEAINADSSLLPGYNLRIVWEDEQCTASVARNFLLQNLVEEVYYSYGEGHVDTDGDGLISTEESLPLQEVWNSSQVTTSPVALLGAGCSSSSMDINVVAYRFSLPIISPGSSNSALSDRSSYPNFFRTLAPDSDYLKGWCNLLQALSVSKVFLIVGETSVFGVNLERLVAVAGEASIELLGDDLTSEVSGLFGYQISSDSWSSAKEALQAVRSSRARFVGAQLYDPRFRLLLCAAVKEELSTLVWLVGSVVAAGFWLRTDQTEISGLEWCTAEVVTKAANGVIQGNVAFWRSDSETTLTCGNGLTAGDFKTKFYTEQKVAVGSDSLSELGWYVMGEGACSADAVCMYAQALHELLVIEQRDREELSDYYDDFIEALGNSDFEGLQGRLTYEPGNPDPAGILTYYQVQSSTAPCAGQSECSSTVSWTMVGIQAPSSSVIEFVAPMMFHFPEERWEASGPTPVLSPSLEALFPECESGLVYDYISRECGKCPESQTFLELTSTCVCSVGYYSGTSGCEACPAGRYSASVGSTACSECSKGQFGDATGLSACERCPKATYANTLGSTTCESCPGSTITDGSGFTDASDCKCNEGYFDSSLPSSNSPSTSSSNSSSSSTHICTPCGKGAVCKGFGASPEADAGYQLDAIRWSTSSQEPGLSIFQCQDPQRCPGGGLKVCSEGREGIACAVCRSGLSPASDGSCTPCNGQQLATGIVSAVFFVALISFVYVRSRKSLERLARGSLGFILTAAQLVAAMQTLSVVALVNLEWPDLLRDIFSSLQVLSFDLDVSCFNQPDPLTLYALKLGLLPAGVLYIVILHIGWSCRTQQVARKSSARSLVGPLGSIASALFISVCVTILAPFQCLDHPNGKWTLMKYETQLCWETQHYAMIAMGSVAVVIPIAFVVVVAYATFQFPRRMAVGDTRFLQKFEFVFIRFKPECRWMTLIYLVRNLAISLTPVIPNSFSQLVVLYSIFLSSGIVNAWMTPWKLTSHSVIEVCLNSVFSTFILISMRFVEMPSATTCVGLTLALLGTSLMGMLFYCSGNMYTIFAHKYLTRPKYYKFFLCHHKAAAGAVARLLKMVLADVTPGRVFLDSDDLLDLRSLFDTVSEEVETLVVLCTQELLLRPYCLGEITTSYVDEVPVKPVFISFERPNDDFIDCIKESVDLQCLSEVGLSVQLVRNALNWFRNLEGTKYPSSSSLPDLMSLCQKLGQGNGSPPGQSSEALLKTGGPTNLVCELLLTADGSNPNALASATILQKFLGVRELRAYTFHELMLNPVSLDFDRLNFRCMAVVCTGGCWANSEFLLAFRTATDMKAPCLAVIADDTFTLPNVDVCERIRNHLANESDEAIVTQVLETITFTFKLIALPLAVNGSWPTLQTQCNTICERLVALTTLKSRSDIGMAITHASSMALQQSNRILRVNSKSSNSNAGITTRWLSRAKSRDDDESNDSFKLGGSRAKLKADTFDSFSETAASASRKRLTFEDVEEQETTVGAIGQDLCFGPCEATIDLDSWGPQDNQPWKVARSTL